MSDETHALMLEIGRLKIDSQQHVIQQLENKAAVVLGFALVSVVEVLGFLLLVAVEPVASPWIRPNGVRFFFICGILAIVAGSLSGLLALRGNASNAIRASRFLELSSGSVEVSSAEIDAALLEGMQAAMRRNSEVIRIKRAELLAAAALTAIGLCCYTVVVVELFLLRY